MDHIITLLFHSMNFWSRHSVKRNSLAGVADSHGLFDFQIWRVQPSGCGDIWCPGCVYPVNLICRNSKIQMSRIVTWTPDLLHSDSFRFVARLQYVMCWITQLYSMLLCNNVVPTLRDRNVISIVTWEYIEPFKRFGDIQIYLPVFFSTLYASTTFWFLFLS